VQFSASGQRNESGPAESPPLEAVIRERLVKTQQTEEDLAYVVVICKVLISTMAL
jgi:hypothetical protein